MEEAGIDVAPANAFCSCLSEAHRDLSEEDVTGMMQWRQSGESDLSERARDGLLACADKLSEG